MYGGHELKAGAIYTNPEDTASLNSGSLIVHGGVAVRKKLRVGKQLIIESDGAIITGNVTINGNLTVTGDLTVTGEANFGFISHQYETVNLTSDLSILGRPYTYCSTTGNFAVILPPKPPNGRTCIIVKLDDSPFEILIKPANGDFLPPDIYLKSMLDNVRIEYNTVQSTWMIA